MLTTRRTGSAYASVALLLSVGVACGGHEKTTAAGHAAPSIRHPRHNTATTASPSRPSAAAPAAQCPALPSHWSLSRMAAEVTTFPVEANDLEAARGAIRAGAGGILMFGDGGPHDLKGQIKRLDRQAPGLNPIVMTDEEGGEVQRVANLVGSLPWARTAAATLSPASLEAKVDASAKRMRAIGIDMDLAPVLDLSDGPGPDLTHPDGLRSFSINPTVTRRYGLAFERGLNAGGVIPVVKHFPGLGTATNNTDTGKALIATLPVLEHRDLLPFQAAIKAGIPAVMMSNAVITGGVNAPVVVQHRIVTGLLRHRLGFHGLIVTDALSAGAVSAAGYTASAASVAALRAGADLTLVATHGTASDLATFSLTVRTIVDAVDSGHLPLATLRTATTLVSDAQAGLPCLRSRTVSGARS